MPAGWSMSQTDRDRALRGPTFPNRSCSVENPERNLGAPLPSRPNRGMRRVLFKRNRYPRRLFFIAADITAQCACVTSQVTVIVLHF